MAIWNGYFAQLIGWTILNFAWQGSFLAISVRISDFLLRKSTAAVRYRVFSSHWAALAAAPCLTVLLAHNTLISVDPSKITDVVGNGPLPLSVAPALFLRLFHLTIAVPS